MLFFRCSTDDTQTDATAALENIYAGTDPTACWLVGSGPSLVNANVQRIAASPAVKIGVNFSGRWKDGNSPLLVPDIWTSFDPTSRFHRSIFTNPRIMKFLKAGKHNDLVPGTNFKACDCPATYFFRTETRGYADFLNPKSDYILNALDSFLQALDLGFRLGFRTFYCVGAEFIIRPSTGQVAAARQRGVDYDRKTGVLVTKEADPKLHYRSDRLSDFLDECIRKWGGADRQAVLADLQAAGREQQYSFSETKPFIAAVNADTHYWERVQYLRLARRNLSLHGVRLVSCTQESRLNAWFPFEHTLEVCDRLNRDVGRIEDEKTAGRYSGHEDSFRESLPYHRDVAPYDWAMTKQRRAAVPPVSPAPAAPIVHEPVAVDAAPPADRMKAAAEKFRELADAPSPVPVPEAF